MEGSCRVARLVFVFIGQVAKKKKQGCSCNWASCKGTEKVVKKEYRGTKEGARKVLNSAHPEIYCKIFLVC